MRKKLITAIIALSLVLSCMVGITVAWLSVKTPTVTNTFSPSDITLELKETNVDGDSDKQNTYQMVPGQTITKDPVVTVKNGSEACWLFVKVEKSANFDDFMTFDPADGWTLLSGTDNVYYREVGESADDQSFPVIKDNKVTVLETVTKQMMNGLNGNNPTLTFTAYAIQRAGFDAVADAWTEAQKLG